MRPLSRHVSGTEAPLLWVLAAFGAIYVVWGSTYLAIRLAIETLPPFFMAASRFLIAGMLVYIWARLRGAPPPTSRNWVAAGVTGGLLLTGGNGAVVWSEQYIPSGVAALIVAAVPLWMVLIDWLTPGGWRPGLPTLAGILVGFAGVGLLVLPSAQTEALHVPLLPAVVLVLGSLCWSLGSVLNRRVPLPASPRLGTGMQMLSGSLLLLLLAAVTGELREVDISAVSATTLLALAYLIVFGSVVGFSAYVWLLRVTSPARVSTYAFVNPPVAVLLGWLAVSEPLTPRIGLVTGMIVLAVVLVTWKGGKRGERPLPLDNSSKS